MKYLLVTLLGTFRKGKRVKKKKKVANKKKKNMARQFGQTETTKM